MAEDHKPGTRIYVTRIDNGWLLECSGSTRFVSEMEDIPKELPGLIAAGKMRATTNGKY